MCINAPIIKGMYVEPGTYIDLTYLNKKPKKKGYFSAQLNASESDNLYEPGTKIMFVFV